MKKFAVHEMDVALANLTVEGVFFFTKHHCHYQVWMCCQQRPFTWLLFSVFTAGPTIREPSPISVRMTKVRPSPNGEPELSSLHRFKAKKK